MKNKIFQLITLLLAMSSCSEAPKQTPTTTEQAPQIIAPPAIDTSKISPKSLAQIADTTQAAWRCFGTEPFWSVEISEAKNMIKYKPADGDSTLMPFVKADAQGNTWVFNTPKMKLVIKKEKCSDGMSDIVHEYSASVTMGGQELKGCARRL